MRNAGILWALTLAAMPGQPTAHPSQPAAEHVRTITSSARFRRLRFSPDGKYLLAQDHNGIVVLSMEPFRVLFRAPADNANDAEFTADSRQVVFISGASHADARQVVFVKSDAHVERWDVSGGRQASSTAVKLQNCDSDQLSPDGLVAACVDFGGTLRLVDVASGESFFEKKNFGRNMGQSIDSDKPTSGDAGSATIDFSPDSRYVIVKPLNAEGTPVAWDLRQRTPVSLGGRLKELRYARYAFVAPGRMVISYDRYGFVRQARISALVEFPSGKQISKLTLPPGWIERAADPGFVLVRSDSTQQDAGFRFSAIEFRTGRVSTKQTQALDVFGSCYVMERADGLLEVYDRNKELGNYARSDDYVRAKGTVVRVAGDRFVVSTDDRREVTFLVTGETKFFASGKAITFQHVRPGALVQVEASENENEEFAAVNVSRLAVATLVSGEEAASSAAEKESGEAAGDTLAHKSFLAEALDLAMDLTALPDHGCHEQTTRYRSDDHTAALWRQKDVVASDVMWREGQKEYRKVTIDGRPGDPAGAGNGTWSSGDFSSILTDIAEPVGGSRLRYGREERLGNSEAVGYLFEIDPEDSHWVVQEGGQSFRPARRGTIWFDRKTKQVLRVEFQAEQIPPTFPAATIQMTLDYAYVQLDQTKYLVPVHVELLGCRRSVDWCTKESTEIGGYRRVGNGTGGSAPPVQ